ncbi:aldo/keto reductase [Pararhodonellum marinum]|uniref:aldo/keto reductase n=1 Tax=Pararhodonellum marinum TaxID=2755358 RepID=UPI001890B378|nr:aldo/keto reductase [Pararhodonellum marinum]
MKNHITFKNGDSMPKLGLGTWKSEPGEVYQAVIWAIEAGYRHIDCAAIYQNEKEVGAALYTAFKNNLVKREDMFITSKLWNNAHLEDAVIPALEQSLSDLQLDYLDLYLVHWPIAFKQEVGFPRTQDGFLTYQEAPLSGTWKGMEAAQEQGLTKHIGVSNFNSLKLKEIMKGANRVPEMNQIELHPLLPQHALVDFCRKHDIQVTAYSPLGSSDRASSMKKDDEPLLMEDEVVKGIAEKQGVSPAQILIAWALHRDTVVIPKSVNQDRIKQNFAAQKIELESADMEKLNHMESSYRFVDGSFFTFEGSPYQLSDLWEDA